MESILASVINIFLLSRVVQAVTQMIKSTSMHTYYQPITSPQWEIDQLHVPLNNTILLIGSYYYGASPNKSLCDFYDQ